MEADVDRLLSAVQTGDLDEIRKQISQHHERLLGTVDAKGNNLWHIAAKHNQLDVFKWLCSQLTSQTPLSQKNAAKLTPVYYAIKHDALETLEWIAENCTEAKAQLDYAVSGGCGGGGGGGRKGMLTSTPARPTTALHFAARHGKIRTLEWLSRQYLVNGHNINQKDNLGNSALHLLCAQHNHIPAIKVLLFNGADLRDRNIMGMKAQDVARCNGNLEAADYLVAFECCLTMATETSSLEHQLALYKNRQTELATAFKQLLLLTKKLLRESADACGTTNNQLFEANETRFKAICNRWQRTTGRKGTSNDCRDRNPLDMVRTRFTESSLKLEAPDETMIELIRPVAQLKAGGEDYDVLPSLMPMKISDYEDPFEKVRMLPSLQTPRHQQQLGGLATNCRNQFKHQPAIAPNGLMGAERSDRDNANIIIEQQHQDSTSTAAIGGGNLIDFNDQPMPLSSPVNGVATAARPKLNNIRTSLTTSTTSSSSSSTAAKSSSIVARSTMVGQQCTTTVPDIPAGSSSILDADSMLLNGQQHNQAMGSQLNSSKDQDNGVLPTIRPLNILKPIKVDELSCVADAGSGSNGHYEQFSGNNRLVKTDDRKFIESEYDQQHYQVFLLEPPGQYMERAVDVPQELCGGSAGRPLAPMIDRCPPPSSSISGHCYQAQGQNMSNNSVDNSSISVLNGFSRADKGCKPYQLISSDSDNYVSRLGTRAIGRREQRQDQLNGSYSSSSQCPNGHADQFSESASTNEDLHSQSDSSKKKFSIKKFSIKKWLTSGGQQSNTLDNTQSEQTSSVDRESTITVKELSPAEVHETYIQGKPSSTSCSDSSSQLSLKSEHSNNGQSTGGGHFRTSSSSNSDRSNDFIEPRAGPSLSNCKRVKTDSEQSNDNECSKSSPDCKAPSSNGSEPLLTLPADLSSGFGGARHHSPAPSEVSKTESALSPSSSELSKTESNNQRTARHKQTATEHQQIDRSGSSGATATTGSEELGSTMSCHGDHVNQQPAAIGGRERPGSTVAPTSRENRSRQETEPVFGTTAASAGGAVPVQLPKLAMAGKADEPGQQQQHEPAATNDNHSAICLAESRADSDRLISSNPICSAPNKPPLPSPKVNQRTGDSFGKGEKEFISGADHGKPGSTSRGEASGSSTSNSFNRDIKKPHYIMSGVKSKRTLRKKNKAAWYDISDDEAETLAQDSSKLRTGSVGNNGDEEDDSEPDYGPIIFGSQRVIS